MKPIYLKCSNKKAFAPCAAPTERFFLYTKEEILLPNIEGTVVRGNESHAREVAAMIREIGEDRDRHTKKKNGHVKRTGRQVWIASAGKSIMDDRARIVEILRIGDGKIEDKEAEEDLCLARDEHEMRARDRTIDLARVNEELRLAEEKQHRTLEGVIQAVSLMLEKRDPYTAGHERHVAQLASAMAKEMGLSHDQTEGVELAARIHDIGKISVPAEILCKPGKLSEAEFSLIKAHPTVGHDILEPIDFPWPIAEMVRQHHEKLDGSGYPQGLHGSEILREARILCIADRVEAMASHRPYRPALGVDAALDEIARNARRLYDGEAADACVKLFREDCFVFQ